MRDLLTTFGEIAGAILVTAGSWQLAHWLGFIVGGVLLVALSWLASHAEPEASE